MSSLEDLAQHRGMLLLAEATAWLHDMGKCDERHIQQHALGFDKDNPANEAIKKYDYQKDHSYRVGTRYLELLGERILLKDLIEEGRPYSLKDINKPWLVRTLGFCHAAAHTEKEEAYYLCPQTIVGTHRGNPFGYESEPLVCLKARLDELPFEQLSDRSSFKRSVEKTLVYAVGDTQRPINEVTLWDWSSMVAALYKAALAAALLGYKEDPPKMNWRLLSVRLKGAAFSERVARIPDLLVRQKLITDGLNRVRRLLEEIYSVGTEVYRDEDGCVFIVPNIENLLTLENGQGENLSGLIVREFNAGTISDQISLRLDGEALPSIQLDKGEPWTRPQDARYEHQRPLPIDEHLKETPSSHADPHSIRNWWQGYREDICTVCQLRPQGWRPAGNVAHYERRVRGMKCPRSCQTCKALERKVCGICEERREDRSKEWAEKALDTTIWLDEIADAHGRLALVVGKFDLEHWLNGDMLFYPQKQKALARVVLRIKHLSAPLSDGHILPINGNNYIWHQAAEVFVSQDRIDLDQVPKRFKSKMQNWFIDRPKEAPKALPQESIKVKDIHRLPNGHYRIDLEENISSVPVGSSFPIWGRIFRVADNSSQIETASDEAVKLVEDQVLHPGKLMVEQSFRLPEMVETQTPARLHRVWETTQRFWEEITSNFGASVGERSPRLRFRASFISESGASEALADFHTYELKQGSISLSIVYAGREFLTVDNLERTAVLLNPSGQRPQHYSAAATEVCNWLRSEKELDQVFIEEPTGYGSPNKILGKLHITEEIALVEIPYTPAIAILIEPRTFMAIVPADKAMEVASAIKDKYEKEMGKVRNRLALTLGIVFAGSHTPLPAILDAGRRMLKQPIVDECWTITNVEPALPRSSWPSEVKLTLAKIKGSQEKSTSLDSEHENAAFPLPMNGQSLPVKVQTVMGDKTTRDEWFPYWCMKSPVPGEWVHTCDLQEGDVVHLMPSRFDFEFLDTAGRRFEVSYEGNRRRCIPPSSRPYYLEQLNEFEELWTVLSQGLTTTQIHNLLGIVETKRAEWQVGQQYSPSQQTFEAVVHDALCNAEWRPNARPGEDQFRWLCQAAVSGQLTDVVELYIRILKCPTQLDKEEGNS